MLNYLNQHSPLNTIIQIHAIENGDLLRSFLVYAQTAQSLRQRTILWYSFHANPFCLFIDLRLVIQFLEASYCRLKELHVSIEVCLR